ncbi:MAG: nucleotidyltransferase family protein, partial [Anaerolineales bacterium]|nr:nucleotidyltransferase family protein [Anaerolineales bacterium]
NGILLEIHWAIIDAIFPFRIEVEELWSRTQTVTLAQAPALALAPKDLLLHLCLHTAKHANEMRIRMVCDIGEVVRCHGMELDWQELGARAGQWDAIRAVYLILRLAQELLEIAVPADWLISLRPDSFSEGYLDLAREQILGRHSDMKTSQLGSNYTLHGHKLRFLKELKAQGE